MFLAMQDEVRRGYFSLREYSLALPNQSYLYRLFYSSVVSCLSNGKSSQVLVCGLSVMPIHSVCSCVDRADLEKYSLPSNGLCAYRICGLVGICFTEPDRRQVG